MYWQVYLHKTGWIAEYMLVNILKRAKRLTEQGVVLSCSKALQFFLSNRITKDDFSDEVLKIFSRLDDYDIVSALKEWVDHTDQVLSNLSRMLVNRELLKIEIHDTEISLHYISSLVADFMKSSKLSEKRCQVLCICRSDF